MGRVSRADVLESSGSWIVPTAPNAGDAWRDRSRPACSSMVALLPDHLQFAPKDRGQPTMK
jgi:hypothetical protein